MLENTTHLYSENPTLFTLPQLRRFRDGNHTSSVGDTIFDKRTAEIIGCYLRRQYVPEPLNLQIEHTGKTNHHNDFLFLDDGSIEPSPTIGANPHASAEVLQFPVQEPSAGSNAGRPTTVLSNPIAGLLQHFRFDGYSTAWIDDRVCGAAGVQVEREGGDCPTTGRFNVSPSDVRRVLYLPEISTETAASILCNHNVQPMSTRQIERVVQAARIALGSLMLHLERNTELQEQFEYHIDFERFWTERSAHIRGESPDKATAILLFEQGETVAAVAKRLGVHRNTASRWRIESMHAPLTTDIIESEANDA